MVEACEPSIWSSPLTSSPELSSRELKGEMHMSQVWFFVGWDPNFFLFPFFEPKWQRFLTFIEWDVYQWNASWIFKFFILLHYSVCCVNMHCPLPMKSLQISLSVKSNSQPLTIRYDFPWISDRMKFIVSNSNPWLLQPPTCSHFCFSAGKVLCNFGFDM